MGAYSTSPLRTVEQPADAAAPRPRRVSETLARATAWLIFLGGLVGAGLGIAGLHVEIAVAGLILACTAGLVLLKLRADALAGR
ncbi:hypothetical protein [Nocardia sp. NPDC050406]|uniref:hypothetical protein n=1 Tax=Nocardia sp. NPDC050406 TaxID=3364318 RepID=UPI0037B96A9E